MTIIPVGDFQPDKPAYLGTHGTVVTNVFPRPDGSVGPLKARVDTGIAILGSATTAIIGRSGDGVARLYVGVMEIGSLDSGSIRIKNGTTFTNHGTTTVGYPTSMFPWRFCQFGELIVATNPVNGVFYHTMGNTGAFTAATGAPAAAFCATIEPGFLMLGYLSDASRSYPARLRWGAINSATDWPLVASTDAASKQSDQQDLPNGTAITGILSAVGGAAGVVLTETSVYRMEYVGAPLIFAFREVVRGTGNLCVNGSIAIAGAAYFISETGFIRFDGSQTAEIGSGRVSAFFWSQVDRGNLHRVNVAHDPVNKIVIWAYPGPGSTNGNPNRWLIYSYASDRWSYADDPGVECSILFTGSQEGHSIDNYDALFPQGMDGSPSFSLDGRTLNGGAPLLGAFNTIGVYAAFTGANLTATVETGETDASGKRLFVTSIRPMTDAPAPTAAVGYRDAFYDAIAYTAATGLEATGTCPQRINTRYARARISIPSAQSWTYLQGADVMVRPAGKR